MVLKVGMYLRTTKRKNQDGSVVEYYQLAHNSAMPRTGRPVAEIIYNFGRADELERDDLVRCAARLPGFAAWRSVTL